MNFQSKSNFLKEGMFFSFHASENPFYLFFLQMICWCLFHNIIFACWGFVSNTQVILFFLKKDMLYYH